MMGGFVLSAFPFAAAVADALAEAESLTGQSLSIASTYPLMQVPD